MRLVSSIKHNFLKIISKVRSHLPKGSFGRLIITLGIVVLIPATVVLVRQVVKLLTRAQVATVNVYVNPSATSLPPNSTFQIMLNSGSSQIAFVRFVANFDPGKVNLASEITATSSLVRVVEKTSMAQANSSGSLTIVLGLDPLNKGNPPSGVFELANFDLSPTSSTTNDTATLSFDNAEFQIVNMNANELNVSATGANLTLNFQPTATLSPSPTPASIRTPTPTTFVSSTPALTLTPTPTPTPIPSPSTFPTSGPTVTPGATITATPPPALAGDINSDGVVNLLDYSILFAAFGSQPPSDARADLNGDGKINLLDYSILFANFGKTL